MRAIFTQMLLLKDTNISITRVGENSAAEAHKRLQNLKQKKKRKERKWRTPYYQ